MTSSGAAAQTGTIRVVIADDEALIASSLSTLLSLEEDIDVIGTFASGEELLEWWIKQLTFGEPVADVGVLDLNMTGIDGIDTAAKLLQQSPDAGMMIVTSHARPRGLKRALAVGVRGFLPKTSSAEEFASGIRAVHEGKRHLDADVAAAAIGAGESPLSEREAEILEVAGEGGSVEDIAARVHLASGTVRNYLSSAMGKLAAANRFEAYSKARDEGWL
ncbi:Transcriptional regulatory protein UhpA [Corynebacterium urogenitale]|uniref:Transcriptional regulatory protein UhpA n=1 Tax=Corynebacterium urogenitale TaxID=2487892 RepID=A0A5J6Z5R7_9CORY|nr:response regulator transcription factor [Corynebacterium urogenitale]QFQ01671.1 Transcriptional regulatory protein UhpA [Corynebacterium urogenitale]